MAFPLLMTLLVGVSIRAWLFRSGPIDWLASRNEIASPLTAWKRVTEGLALNKMGISPYTGDIFHEMPLMLRMYKSMSYFWGPAIDYAFVVLDIIMALVLERIAKHFGRYMLAKQTREVKTYSPDATNLILWSDQMQISRLYVVAVYLLNPYTVATCLAKSTAIFNNIAVALAILFMLKGQRGSCCFFIAFSTYISMYPIMLVVPAALCFSKRDKKGFTHNSDIAASLLQVLVGSFVVLAGLLYASFIIEGTWGFLQSTYGFILSVPDLNPNMGLFWYFFTEMFEHFRSFFICVFQINALIYTVPLALRLKDDPMFFTYILVGLMAVFKSYPTYADTALYLSLLPLWKHIFPYMRNNFVVTCMFVTCTVLAPILWHLWMYAGSANANFFFAFTLVYSTAQIFLVTDVLFAYLRRKYDVIHGTKVPVMDGKLAKIILD